MSPALTNYSLLETLLNHHARSCSRGDCPDWAQGKRASSFSLLMVEKVIEAAIHAEGQRAIEAMKALPEAIDLLVGAVTHEEKQPSSD